jgi:hypothetical protein
MCRVLKLKNGIRTISGWKVGRDGAKFDRQNRASHVDMLRTILTKSHPTLWRKPVARKRIRMPASGIAKLDCEQATWREQAAVGRSILSVRSIAIELSKLGRFPPNQVVLESPRTALEPRQDFL